ncbi:MAG: HAMP domain-containing histidine kinase, partial [Arcobacteraceae bacterium]|nr:HAMP domain-containing histidine kinase [Arcobacteraceae bacterium]
EMISMIAHQWRQPLAAISSTSSGINLKAKLNKLDKDTAIELSNKISEYSQHLSGTIDDFREFFKESKKKEITTLEDIVNSTLNIVKTSVENQNIKIIKDFNCNVKLETYPNEVKQVILNIIKNAEDILLENKVKSPTITISSICTVEHSKYALIIKDNAGGIPEDVLPKIFEPYFTTKHQTTGTGIGLYMSYDIVTKHFGGKLYTKNTENGAKFYIEIPKSK